MRYVLLGMLLAVILVLATVGQVRADGGLTTAVAAAYFPRNVDATLHDIAHSGLPSSGVADASSTIECAPNG